MKTICPIMASDSKEAVKQFEILENSGCDWIELRLDPIEDLLADEMAAFAAAMQERSSKPILATFRTCSEGGVFDLSKKAYEKLIHELIQAGLYTDVQLDRYLEFEKKADLSRVFLSRHDFEKTLDHDQLVSIWNQMESFKPYCTKIAVMPHSMEDVVSVLTSSLDAVKNHHRIVISMAEKGRISRVIADLFGGDFTFCAYTTSSAPGQVGLAELARYRSESGFDD